MSEIKCKNCKNFICFCCSSRSNFPMYPEDDCPKPQYFNAIKPEGKIIAVAMIVPGANNIIFSKKNSRHCYLFPLAKEYGLKRPYREIQGFLTENGCFLDREEGAEYVLKIGQISKLKYNNDRLFSEDLW